jgi:nickel-dependent lactate racemase
MIVHLPYGKTFVEFDAAGASVLASRIDQLKSDGDGRAIVKKAMQSPIDSPKLSELAKGKKNAVIIVSDHTRPVPSRDILPHMLRELRQGNPDIDVTLLVSTGCHLPTTQQELIDKMGEEIVRSEKITIHDSRDASSNVKVGSLPSGAPLIIDRAAAETELLVSEGFIEPHFFAGFSGGRKSVLPGICDQATVLGNHCSKFIDSPYSRTGVLDGNPIHIDMLAAAKIAKLAFIVNVVIDEQKKTVAAFAGNFETAHRAGCDFLRKYCVVNPVPADIVITTNGGAPLDQNFYQCVKSMTAAEATAKAGGVIIECAQCLDGTGGDAFYHSLKDCESVEALYEQFMRTSQAETIPDQWQSQVLARVLKTHRVILVSRPEMEQIAKDMKMEYAKTLPEAMEAARDYVGRDASITVIPNGISVIVGNQ